MARSERAVESFTLPIVQQSSAQGPGTYKIPGFLRVKRQYTGGQDSQGGDWIQLTPGLFFQPHANRTAAAKGGRALHAQFEKVEIVSGLDAPFRRLDYKG